MDTSSLSIADSWVEVDGNGYETMATTVRIVENLDHLKKTEEQYLADLEQEFEKPGVTYDLQMEKKLTDTLTKMVLNSSAEISETATKRLAHFISLKLKTIDLLTSVTDQLYDHFAMMMPTENSRPLALNGLKAIIGELQISDYSTGASREFQLISRLLDSLIPRIIGGLCKANIEDSVGMLKLLQRRFGAIINTHPTLKNICLWEDYCCTGQELGRGAYSTVYLGRHVKTAKTVAIKAMDWDRLTRGSPKTESTLRNEIEILRTMDHSHIVKLYDVLREGAMVYIIMEYCGGGSLEEYINKKGPLPEDEVQHFTKQLALGLQYMRGKGIIHRDLKPENLLLTVAHETGNLKIADFTFARYIEPGDLATTIVGSPLYMAPELFFARQYTEKADLWSVGAIIYKMLTKMPPYPSISYSELIQKMGRGNPVIPQLVSADMKDLLASLLQCTPELRISWTEFFHHSCLGLNRSMAASVRVQLTDSEQLLLKDQEMNEMKKNFEGLKASHSRLEEELKSCERQKAKLADENRLLQELLKNQNDRDYLLRMFSREQQVSDETEKESQHWKKKCEEKEEEITRLKLQKDTSDAKVRVLEEQLTEKDALLKEKADKIEELTEELEEMSLYKETVDLNSSYFINRLG
jgi:serine/threonine protein kinase